jgi:hypothetical protein
MSAAINSINLPLVDDYYTFLSEFNKSVTVDDFEERYEAFYSAKRSIEELQKHSTFHLRLNQFADLMPDEFSSLFSTIDGTVTGPSFDGLLEGGPDHLPNDIDWSTENNHIGENVLPPIQNQGSCGACWAFSAIGCTQASLRIQGYPQVDL